MEIKTISRLDEVHEKQHNWLHLLLCAMGISSISYFSFIQIAYSHNFVLTRILLYQLIGWYINILFEIQVDVIFMLVNLMVTVNAIQIFNQLFAASSRFLPESFLMFYCTNAKHVIPLKV